MLDVVNQHVTKIVLAAEDGDSINRISKKIGASYGWTHRWVERLEEIGVVERDDGIRFTDKGFTDAFETVAKTVLQQGIEVEDAYLLPNFSGMDYAYTGTDAVFIWTKGGYQIGRNQEDYPIFMNVYEEDVEAWEEFFDEYAVASQVEERGGDGIHFVLFPREGFEREWVENASVTPLQETVAWAQRYEVNFQPALEMLDELYDLELGVEYRERKTL